VRVQSKITSRGRITMPVEIRPTPRRSCGKPAAFREW